MRSPSCLPAGTRYIGVEIWELRCSVLTIAPKPKQCRTDHSFQISVDIDDLEVDLLVESFGLGFRPSTLCYFDEKKNKRKVIPIKSKKKFKPGEKYYLQQNAGTGMQRVRCCT